MFNKYFSVEIWPSHSFIISIELNKHYNGHKMKHNKSLLDLNKYITTKHFEAVTMIYLLIVLTFH